MHAVCKKLSTAKLKVVFDSSARSESGVSLKDRVLVGPTVNTSLVDVLPRFLRFALMTDVRKMYRAVLLPEDQRDLDRFAWREDPSTL